MSILQTVELKKYYGIEPNITRMLDGVNLYIEQGEFEAVVGTSDHIVHIEDGRILHQGGM